MQPAAASAQAQLLHQAALDGQAPAEGGGARPHRQPCVLPRLQAPAACRGREHTPHSVPQVEASDCQHVAKMSAFPHMSRPDWHPVSWLLS